MLYENKFYDNFVSVCTSRGLKPTPVAVACGVSNNSASKWKGGTIPNGETIIKLAQYLNCSTDRLLLGRDPVPNPKYQQMIEIYEQLTPDNKDMAVKMFAAFFSIQTERERKKHIIHIRHSLLKASAGTGYGLVGADEDIIDIVDTPEARKADFAVTVEGDSMLPDYKDGDVVLVKYQPEIEEGQIGIFIVDDTEGFIKKRGSDRLISLNPDYDDIQFSDHENVECKGHVIGIAEIAE